MLAYDFPLLASFFFLLFLFIWIVWLILLIRTVVDIFRSYDLSGWGKAAWLIFVALVPYLGVFVYLIARGHKIHEHDMARAQASEAALQSYIRTVAGSREAPRTRSPSWPTSRTAGC